MSNHGKPTVAARDSGERRSRQLRTTTCVAGLAAAGVGLVYVLTGNTRAVDVVLIVGGLLAVLAGLVLMRKP